MVGIIVSIGFSGDGLLGGFLETYLPSVAQGDHVIDVDVAG